MKPKTLILMIVAVVCGLAASYMTSRVIAERNSQPAEEETVTVLVAKQKILVGTLIKEPAELFVEKAFTVGREPKKAIRSFEEVKDRRLNKTLSEEQFVTTEDLMDPNHSGLDTVLPEGMRAIGLKVNPESIVGGFVLPNCRVDVVSTVRMGDKSYSQIILQNMLVLASDMQHIRDEKHAMMASTVTLAAKPDDCGKLRLAATLGELSLLLRNQDDEKIEKARPIRPVDVTKSSDASVSTAEGEENEGGAGGLPMVPDVPATTPRIAVPGEPPLTPLAPLPPPPKTVTQVIYNGESVTKTVFVAKEDGEVVTQTERTGMERPNRPERKPVVEEPLSPKPAAPAGEAGKAPGSEPKTAGSADPKQEETPEPKGGLGTAPVGSR